MKSRALICAAAVSACLLAGHAQAQADYTWRHVPIGAASVVEIATGSEPPLRLIARTDCGTAFQLNTADLSWSPLFPGTGYGLLSGSYVDALGFGHGTNTVLYAAVTRTARHDAESADGDILRSTDGGATWTPAGLKLYMSPLRGIAYGRRLQVDVGDSTHIIYGSIRDGLWHSCDAGKTWARWTKAPDMRSTTAAPGVRFIEMDPRGLGMYVGAREGVYFSSDSGTTWQLLPGSPVDSYRAHCAIGDIVLYVTHAKGIARYAGGAWTDITPKGYVGQRIMTVSAHTMDANHIMASVYTGTGGPSLLRSRDGGKTWRPIQSTHDHTRPWWPEAHWGVSIWDARFDLLNVGAAWMSDRFGIWMTQGIIGNAPEWTALTGGMEASSVRALCSMPENPGLLSGLVDLEGFDHDDPREPPARMLNACGIDRYFVSTGIDFAEERREVAVRVGSYGYGAAGKGFGAISTTGGGTWTMLTTPPEPRATGGRVALSAEAKSMLYLPAAGTLYVSKDLGKTWTASTGAPAETPFGTQPLGFWDSCQPLASHRATDGVFYLLASDGGVFASTDGGDTWERRATPFAGVDGFAAGLRMVRTTPFAREAVWVSGGGAGLHASADGGKTFVRVVGVDFVQAFDFGCPREYGAGPTVFLYGSIAGKPGIYRSDDLGTTWQPIASVSTLTLGAGPHTLAGDRQTYGRVYLGTTGHGLYCGEPKRD